MKTFGNQRRFVELNSTVSPTFDAKHPFTTHNIQTWCCGWRLQVPLRTRALISSNMAWRHTGNLLAIVKQLSSTSSLVAKEEAVSKAVDLEVMRRRIIGWVRWGTGGGTAGEVRATARLSPRESEEVGDEGGDRATKGFGENGTTVEERGDESRGGEACGVAKTSCIEDPSGVEEGKMEGETWRGN